MKFAKGFGLWHAQDFSISASAMLDSILWISCNGCNTLSTTVSTWCTDLGTAPP
jgi:hypothetical protein